jgi:hypothetical protein
MKLSTGPIRLTKDQKEKINKVSSSIEAILIALRIRTLLAHLNDHTIPATADYYKFEAIYNRKYAKIILVTTGYGGYVSKSAWCFVDRKTGEVFKPAGWRGPAKKSGPRFNLYDDASMDELLVSADLSGRCFTEERIR